MARSRPACSTSSSRRSSPSNSISTKRVWEVIANTVPASLTSRAPTLAPGRPFSTPASWYQRTRPWVSTATTWAPSQDQPNRKRSTSGVPVISTVSFSGSGSSPVVKVPVSPATALPAMRASQS